MLNFTKSAKELLRSVRICFWFLVTTSPSLIDMKEFRSNFSGGAATFWREAGVFTPGILVAEVLAAGILVAAGQKIDSYKKCVKLVIV